MNHVSAESSSSSEESPDVRELVALFHEDASELGSFRRVAVEEVPGVPRRLLAHHEHMTVSVESHHESAVSVDVLHTWETDDQYAREILLRRVIDDVVVQFGIVRLRWCHLDSEVRSEIESQRTPLGRILIEHNVLREVECVALWEVRPGPALRDWLGMRSDEVTYGRTALIHVEGEPAVELLEIVVPDDVIARNKTHDAPGGSK